MVKVNHQLDYSKCTVEELRGFIKSRTGKESTAQNTTYLAGKLRALDKNFTFRFMDLPAEMRLVVYAELLHRPHPFVTNCVYSQILATCKEIYHEAEPELTNKANMLIRIAPNHPARGTVCTIGNKTTRPFNIDGMPASEALWPLYDKLVIAVASVHHVAIHISLGESQRARFFPEPDCNRIAQYLFALTAALRLSKLRTLVLRLEPNGVRNLEGLLWPLHRIKSTVTFSMEGVSQNTQDRILSSRSQEDSESDSISKGKELVSRLDVLVALLPHLNDARLLSKVDGLRTKVLRSIRWTRYSRSDEQAMRRLGRVEVKLGAPSMRKSIRKAEKVLEARQTENEQN